jgi:hypothetical protein
MISTAWVIVFIYSSSPFIFDLLKGGQNRERSDWTIWIAECGFRICIRLTTNRNPRSETAMGRPVATARGSDSCFLWFGFFVVVRVVLVVPDESGFTVTTNAHEATRTRIERPRYTEAHEPKNPKSSFELRSARPKPHAPSLTPALPFVTNSFFAIGPGSALARRAFGRLRRVCLRP